MDNVPILVAVAVTIALTGLLVDLHYGHDAFARSGSVIVALGIAMVGRALYRIEKAKARNEGRFEKLEAAWLDAGASGDQVTSQEVFSRLATSFSELRQANVARTGRLMAAEIAITCSGTLIWGFGDLAV